LIQSRQLFSENVYLENKDVVVIVVVTVAKGTVSGMLWHSGLNSDFVDDLPKCTVSKLVHTPATKEEEASIDYHILSLAKHKNFHIIIVQASQEYHCFHSTLNFCSVVVGISCCPIALSSFPFLFHFDTQEKTRRLAASVP